MSAAALLLVIALPAAAALIAGFTGAARPRRAARVGVAAAVTATGAASFVALTVFTGGSVSAVSGAGAPLAGFAADELTVVVLLLITAVSAVVQGFAGRYLHGDAAAHRFFAGAGALTAASAAMVTSATLIGLALAWTLAGVALIALLRLYPDVPGARLGARRTAKAFLIGDGALWLAVVAATVAWGNLDLRTLGLVAPGLVADDPGLVGLVACLLVAAALARSAQLPLQAWLPATLAAPTPVSALLHAGVVNAGGILLIKLSPLFGASAVATHLAFAAGGATVIYGTSLTLTKTDVKGTLAHSTMGQMGFMVMTCGLGAYAAAAFHLVAHGMFKATLFLGSGAAVAQHARAAKAPPRPNLSANARLVLLAASAALPAAALAGSIVVLDVSQRLGGAEALLVFAWATSSAMVWGWIRSRPTARGWLVAVAGAVVALPAYVAALSAAKSVLAPALEGAGAASASPWLLLAVAIPIVAVAVLRVRPLSGALARLQRAAYVAALNAGTVAPGKPMRAYRPAAQTTQTWLTIPTEGPSRP